MSIRRESLALGGTRDPGRPCRGALALFVFAWIETGTPAERRRARPTRAPYGRRRRRRAALLSPTPDAHELAPATGRPRAHQRRAPRRSATPDVPHKPITRAFELDGTHVGARRRRTRPDDAAAPLKCATSSAHSSIASSSRSSSPTASASPACSSPPARTSRRRSTGSSWRSARAWTGGRAPGSGCRSSAATTSCSRASAGAWVEVDEERLLVCRVGELLGVLDETAR